MLADGGQRAPPALASEVGDRGYAEHGSDTMPANQALSGIMISISQLEANVERIQEVLTILVGNSCGGRGKDIVNRTASKRHRVHFAADHVIHTFEPLAAEIEVMEQIRADERAAADADFEEMKKRWAAKGKNKPKGATAEDVDFRTIRVIRLHRGRDLAALGVDLMIRPVETPGTGTYCVVRGVKSGKMGGVNEAAGKAGMENLKKGDRIIQIYDVELSSVEPGAFLGMLAVPTLELTVYNEPDEERHRRAAVEAAEAAEEIRRKEALEREKAANALAQTEKQLMLNWMESYRARAASRSKKQHVSSSVGESPFRTVYIDRRLDTTKDAAVGSDDRAEYFHEHAAESLSPLGISLFVRENREHNGEVHGTFAVISHVEDSGLVAASGVGHNMIWEDDQIIKVQGRHFSDLTPLELLSLMNVRRLELIVCNVDKYADISRNPDIFDDIGRRIDRGISVTKDAIDAWGGRLRGLWSSQVDKMMGKFRGDRSSDSPDGDTRTSEGGYDMPTSLPLLHETSPVIRGASDIISCRFWCKIWLELPRRIQYKECRLVYSTSEDGYSISHFLRKVVGRSPSLLVVQTKSGAVFGAYVTASFDDAEEDISSTAYRGTNEMFVFQVLPKFQKFAWSGLNDNDSNNRKASQMFLHCSKDRIIIGGGGKAPAIVLDDNLHHGVSGRCSTFDNEPLADTSTGHFECIAMELWAFTENVDM